MIFISCLFTLLTVLPLKMAPVNSLPLVEAILKISENSNCPGLVVILADEGAEIEELMLNEFENKLKRPMTLLSHHQEWPRRREIVCSDAVILLRNQTSELLSLYRQLGNSFYLNKVMVVTNLPRQSGSNKLLEELRNERIFMLIESSNSLEIRKWSVSQDRVLLYRDYHQEIDHKSWPSDDSLFKLSGRHLKVATLHHPPAVVIRSFDGSKISNWSSVEGIEPSIMKLIANELNFTFDYVVAPASEMWGDVVTTTDQATGTVVHYFTGIRGMLVRKEVDLAFGDLYMIPSWLSHMSFSQIYKMDYDCFVVPSPKPLANWMALILPFSLKTWMATLASLVLVTAALSARRIRNPSVIESSFLFALGQLLWIQQPRFPDGKASNGNLFLIWSWLFAATILSTVYRSGLISFLTQPFAQQPVNTIQQLVESPLNKIMFSDFYKSVLLNSTDPYRRQLGHQLTTTHNMSQMMALLKTGRWAVDSSLDSLNYLMKDQVDQSSSTSHGNLHIMKEKLFPTRSSFGLQKDSPLKPRVDLVLQRLIEAGLVDYHRSHLNFKSGSPGRRSSGRIDQNNKTILIHFSMTNLQGAFYLLGIGVIISTLALALEFIISIFPSSQINSTK